MAAPATNARALQALKKFTSCDIGDALVKLSYPQGGFLDGLQMFSPTAPFSSSSSSPSPPPQPIIGPALTIQMVETSDTSAPKPEKHFVDYAERGSVMYVHQPPGLPSACWGGLMSTRAQHLGAAGVVINGRTRDVGEHRELGFPVFARDTSILGSNKFTRASRINSPLQFKGDLWIHPGDILVADENGVVVTPPSLLEKVVELCEERAEIDRLTVEGLKQGEAMGPLLKRLRK